MTPYTRELYGSPMWFNLIYFYFVAVVWVLQIVLIGIFWKITSISYEETQHLPFLIFGIHQLNIYPINALEKLCCNLLLFIGLIYLFWTASLSIHPNPTIRSWELSFLLKMSLKPVFQCIISQKIFMVAIFKSRGHVASFLLLNAGICNRQCKFSWS